MKPRLALFFLCTQLVGPLAFLNACASEGEPHTDGAGAAGGDSTTTPSGGSGGQSSASGGSGGAAGLDLQLPIQRGNKLVLEFGSTFFEVEPETGGRVSALRLDTAAILTDRDVHPDNWGATFWTSPQSDWGWPPPAPINDDPYSASVTGNSLHLLGTQASFAGKTIRVRKSFTANLQSEALELAYTMENQGDGPISLAPWEVSRVPSGGLVFFPTGDAAFTPEGSAPLPVSASLGITWFDSAANPPDDSAKKLNADGREGWLAHVRGNLLFLQLFADLPPSAQAPGEGEVEIFAATSTLGGYVELENQGAYQEIPAAGESTYQVTWLVRQLPDTVSASVGSQALLDFVRSLL